MMTLGNFPILHEEGLNQGRGYGVTLCGIVQSKESLDNAAGQGTFQSWMNNTKLQSFFAIRSVELAETISKQIGEVTVEELSISAGHSKQRGKALGADNVNKNISVNMKARKLMDPTEVMQLPREYAIIFMGEGPNDARVGKKPLVVGTCFYKNRPELMALAKPNPFERTAINESAYAVPEGDIATLIKHRIQERRIARGKSAAEDTPKPISEVARMQEWDKVNWEKKGRILAKGNPELETAIKGIDSFLRGEGDDLDKPLKSKISSCLNNLGTSMADTPIDDGSTLDDKEKAKYRENMKALISSESKSLDEIDITFDDLEFDNDNPFANLDTTNRKSKRTLITCKPPILSIWRCRNTIQSFKVLSLSLAQINLTKTKMFTFLR